VKALLRAELIKLRTTRTFVVLTAATLAISLLVVVLTTTIQDEWTEDDARDLFTSDFTGLFILLLGVMGMAGEWRHRTITSTVLAAPRRLRLLSAKTISYAVAGIAISLIVTVAIMAIGTLILSARDLPTAGLGDLADVLWRNLVVAAYLGAFGVCIGGLIRNQIVAIVGLLLLMFAIEPAVIGLAPEVGKFGPTLGAPNGFIGLEDVFGEGDEQLTPAVALLVMIGWVGLAFTAAAARLERRDLV
jgi:ABC-type transport system involved in multi-copper enzyme maturation permease subunit